MYLSIYTQAHDYSKSKVSSFTPTLEASVVSLSLYLSYSKGLMQLSHILKEIITITASSHTEWKESMVCIV